MLVRVSGGKEGIREYLETGRKRGRAQSREELDERVILAGNLALVDSLIHNMDSRGERYLHVTLSFKEDHVEREFLEQIVKDFEDFAFAAYAPKEYALYAEAHLPRVKSLPDKRTGMGIDRKPHIHVVIPKVNLATWKGLDPFGLVRRQVAFLEAFQESENLKYGLASPKDNRRTDLCGQSEVIGRHSGDLFPGVRQELKREILEELISKNASTIQDLQAILETYGVVRIRNAGTSKEYLNLKLDGEEKGINLKEYVFTAEFLSLSQAEKKARLERPEASYICAGLPLSPNPEYETALKEWKDFRSKETKYISSGRRSEYKAYSGMSRSDQFEYLARKHRDHEKLVEQSGEEIAASPTKLELRHTPLQRVTASELEATSSSTVRQLVDDREEACRKAKEEAKRMLREANKNIDPRLLFERLHDKLSRTHNYEIGDAPDGSPRFRCGDRNLSASDFLTKELHLRWSQASDLLCDVYMHQVYESADPMKYPERENWERYARFAWILGQFRKEEQDAVTSTIRARFASRRSEYFAKKKAILGNKDLSASQRKALMSLLQVEYLAAQEMLRQEAGNDYARVRKSNSASILSLYSDVREVEFESAEREVKTATEKVLLRREISASDAGVVPIGNRPAIKGVVRFGQYRPEVRTNGDVVYHSEDRELIRDSGKAVWAIGMDDEAIEACLRLAVLKYGPRLHLIGSEEFKARAAFIADCVKLNIEFDSNLPNVHKKMDLTINNASWEH